MSPFRSASPPQSGWLAQFPAALRQVALVRLVASFGAGGVLYLTPIVFHQAAFSAQAVTQGLALAALAGAGRLARIPRSCAGVMHACHLQMKAALYLAP